MLTDNGNLEIALCIGGKMRYASTCISIMHAFL